MVAAGKCSCCKNFDQLSGVNKINRLRVQALQAQLLQRLAASGGTASLSHISQLPQQTVIVGNGLPQSVQPSANISLMAQQQQAAPSCDENTSVQQQAANGNQCLNSTVSWRDNTSGQSSQSNQIPTEICRNSEAGVSQLTSANVLQSSHLVPGGSDAAYPTHISQLQQHGQSTYAEQHNISQSQSSPAHSQSSIHSRVIDQLQQQLLQSSAKQAVNGCAVTATGDKHTANAVCKGEEGEVDGNELMQFLS